MNKIITLCEEKKQMDRISQLPDDLISEKILSHLSTKEAVKTSVLSTKWRNIWQCLPKWDLPFRTFSKFNAFVSFADRFFDSHKDPSSSLRELRLFVHDFRKDARRLKKPEFGIHDNYPIESYVSSWIDAVARRKIQHLDLCFDNFDSLVEMPPSIYTCEMLVKLRLSRSALVNAESVSLPCLKVMHLENNFYPNEATLEKLISGAQVLEDLTIDNIRTRRPQVIQVRSQTLKRIDISRCTQVVIDAPLLECLITKADETKNFTIINSCFPAKLDIGVISYCGLTENVSRDILADVARVRDLVIPSVLWTYMYRSLKSGPQFRYLSHLNAAFVPRDLEILPNLLNNCPNLESLILKLVEYKNIHRIYFNQPKVDFSTVPQCLVSSLKFVELKSSISKYELEMEIVRYFLKNSSILEKLRLDTYYEEKAKNVILDELLAMPRCSSACEILLRYITRHVSLSSFKPISTKSYFM